MNVTKKVDGHEIVAQLPEKVRKKDQKRAADPNPKPFAFQITVQIGEQYGNHHASDADNHGVLRQHTEEIIEGNILHQRSCTQAEGNNSERSQQLRATSAT